MDAYVYIAGPQGQNCSALFDLVNKLGFAGVSSFRGIEQVAEQTQRNPICFILCSSVSDPAHLRPIAEAVRFCALPRVRFSPLVYLADEPSIETTIACVNMGFDDIVALPQSSAQLRDRLERQLGQVKIYYEASGYFGPDRRRNLVPKRVGLETRQGGPFRRLEVIRDLQSGVSVLRDEIGRAAPPVAPLQSLA
ncbi:hypothetical protein [Devosia sp. FJ2-5-3]|jgi:PleD family two-component response regulator|uniref:hypothetical protein n=1 Tax=Devosia sp. FJ2-5-3 TaxID=2976680 RepID=UPI0023D80A87|nr:hypothetical protein [Devosia sp. FJ2-5-3]WEJ58427.1 hypothetical protein N0P34_20035 [Devosia sp. FJ2-5-3]